MGLAFNPICWILYFPTDMILASELTSAISDAVRSSIACDIGEDNTLDTGLFLKKVVERSIEEYDRKTDGAVKKKLTENWEGESDLSAKELLELKAAKFGRNWFAYAQGKSKNICGIYLELKGVWRGYCKIQTKNFTSVDQTTSLVHKTCVKIARIIIENNKKSGEGEWYPMNWELTGVQTYIHCCMSTMGLPEVLLKRLKTTVEWMQWAVGGTGMRFNSFGSYGQPVLWRELTWSDFEMD